MRPSTDALETFFNFVPVRSECPAVNLFEIDSRGCHLFNKQAEQVRFLRETL